MSTMAPQPALHKRFKYSTCALTDTPFLALDVIDREVTEESVAQTLKDSVKSRNPPKLYAPWTWNPQIPDPKQVVQSARKVFAVLAIIGEPQAIGELLEEGIVDSDLPLKRRSDDIDDNVLVSSEGGKEFVSFANWTEDRRVSEFVAKQWVVLAPVLDDSGKHGKLDSQCALSFLEVDPVGNDSSNAVYRGHLHPAHQRGLQVRVAWDSMESVLTLADDRWAISGCGKVVQKLRSLSAGEGELGQDSKHPSSPSSDPAFGNVRKRQKLLCYISMGKRWEPRRVLEPGRLLPEKPRAGFMVPGANVGHLRGYTVPTSRQLSPR